MERPRVRDRANAVLPSCSWSQRADHATSRIGHETAPNLLSCLLPHRGFHLGAEGLSRAKPEVRIHLPIGSACRLDASRPQSIRIDPGAVIRADAGESANHWFRWDYGIAAGARFTHERHRSGPRVRPRWPITRIIVPT